MRTSHFSVLHFSVGLIFKQKNIGQKKARDLCLRCIQLRLSTDFENRTLRMRPALTAKPETLPAASRLNSNCGPEIIANESRIVGVSVSFLSLLSITNSRPCSTLI